MPQLQLRQKWNKEQPNLRDDDVVLMLDDHAPRNMWLKAQMDIVTCTGRRLEQPLAGNERHTSFLLLYILLLSRP